MTDTAEQFPEFITITDSDSSGESEQTVGTNDVIPTNPRAIPPHRPHESSADGPPLYAYSMPPPRLQPSTYTNHGQPGVCMPPPGLQPSTYTNHGQPGVCMPPPGLQPSTYNNTGLPGVCLPPPGLQPSTYNNTGQPGVSIPPPGLQPSTYNTTGQPGVSMYAGYSQSPPQMYSPGIFCPPQMWPQFAPGLPTVPLVIVPMPCPSLPPRGVYPAAGLGMPPIAPQGINYLPPSDVSLMPHSGVCPQQQSVPTVASQLAGLQETLRGSAMCIGTPVTTPTGEPVTTPTGEPVATSTGEPVATSTGTSLATSTPKQLVTSILTPLATSTPTPLATSDTSDGDESITAATACERTIELYDRFMREKQQRENASAIKEPCIDLTEDIDTTPENIMSLSSPLSPSAEMDNFTTEGEESPRYEQTSSIVKTSELNNNIDTASQDQVKVRKREKCKSCLKVFRTSKGFENHRLHCKERFACRDCGVTFTWKEEACEHHCDPGETDDCNTIKETNHFICETCDRLTFTKLGFTHHMVSHKGKHIPSGREKSFSCPKCRTHYFDKPSLRHHRHVCHNDISTVPPIPPSETNYASVLDLPARIGKYMCPYCCLAFPGAASLREHILNCNTADSTGDSSQENMDCSISESDQEETSAIHIPPVKSYQCNTCGFMGKSRSALVNHDQIHQMKSSETGEVKRHRCKKCKAFFARQKQKVKHDRKVHPKALLAKNHSRESANHTQNTCNICRKTFPSLSSLTRHKLLHWTRIPVTRKQKNFECNICHTLYTEEYEFLSHKKLEHSVMSPERKPDSVGSECKKSTRLSEGSEKRTDCQVCFIQFKTSQKLRTHMEIHQQVDPVTHARKRFPCMPCKAFFLTNDERARHQRTEQHRFLNNKPNSSPQNHSQPEPNADRISGISTRGRCLKHKPRDVCDVCNVKFTSLGHLKAHRGIHNRTHSVTNKLKTFECAPCEAFFMTNGEYLKHKRGPGLHNEQGGFDSQISTAGVEILAEPPACGTVKGVNHTSNSKCTVTGDKLTSETDDVTRDSDDITCDFDDVTRDSNGGKSYVNDVVSCNSDDVTHNRDDVSRDFDDVTRDLDDVVPDSCDSDAETILYSPDPDVEMWNESDSKESEVFPAIISVQRLGPESDVIPVIISAQKPGPESEVIPEISATQKLGQVFPDSNEEHLLMDEDFSARRCEPQTQRADDGADDHPCDLSVCDLNNSLLGTGATAEGLTNEQTKLDDDSGSATMSTVSASSLNHLCESESDADDYTTKHQLLLGLINSETDDIVSEDGQDYLGHTTEHGIHVHAGAPDTVAWEQIGANSADCHTEGEIWATDENVSELDAHVGRTYTTMHYRSANNSPVVQGESVPNSTRPLTSPEISGHVHLDHTYARTSKILGTCTDIDGILEESPSGSAEFRNKSGAVEAEDNDHIM